MAVPAPLSQWEALTVPLRVCECVTGWLYLRLYLGHCGAVSDPMECRPWGTAWLFLPH